MDLNLRQSNPKSHGYFHEPLLSSHCLRSRLAIRLPRFSFDTLTTSSGPSRVTPRPEALTVLEAETQLSESSDLPCVSSPDLPANLVKGTLVQMQRKQWLPADQKINQRQIFNGNLVERMTSSAINRTLQWF